MNIILTNVVKKYKQTTLRYKNQTIHGKIVMLQGSNGSGKTTLLKAIANYCNVEGTILHNEKIAYSKEQVKFPSDLKVESIIDIYQVNQEMIQFFELTTLYKKYGNELSKGETQKVQLAIVFSKEATLYLLDEPFEGLDIKSKIKFIQYIKKIRPSVLFSSHQNIPIECKKVYL